MDIKDLIKDAKKLGNVEVIPNGIYVGDYSSDKKTLEGFVIGFLGSMDYHPNIQAAMKLSEVVERLREKNTDIQLLIIGRNPTQEIINLKTKPGVIVTGSVESIWPYVNATDVFVFPMSYGSGQQNKLLDVMYAGRPVISSSLGNSGIGARAGHDLELADNDDEIIEKVMSLYTDDVKTSLLARRGKEFIEKQYEWDSIFKKMEYHYFGIV